MARNARHAPTAEFFLKFILLIGGLIDPERCSNKPLAVGLNTSCGVRKLINAERITPFRRPCNLNRVLREPPAVSTSHLHLWVLKLLVPSQHHQHSFVRGNAVFVEDSEVIEGLLPVIGGHGPFLGCLADRREDKG